MSTVGLYPNPLIQSLQLASSPWEWTGDCLTVFWHTTAQTMVLQGWERCSHPWDWSAVKKAHHLRLGMDPRIFNATLRLESCIALWLHDTQELHTHPQAEKALLTVYLPQVDGALLDEEAAILWTAVLVYCRRFPSAPLTGALLAWQALSTNNARWIHAYEVVGSLGLNIGTTALYMHRVIHGLNSCETHSLEGLIS